MSCPNLELLKIEDTKSYLIPQHQYDSEADK